MQNGQGENEYVQPTQGNMILKNNPATTKTILKIMTGLTGILMVKGRPVAA
jgi:hypothetical protein